MKKILKKLFYKLERYFGLKVFKAFDELKISIRKRLQYYIKKKSKKKELVFLISSKAEERILGPCVEYITRHFHEKVVVLLIGDYTSPQNELITMMKHQTELLQFDLTAYKGLVCCLNFRNYPKYHHIGLRLTNAFNDLELPTYCIQHGGGMLDNLNGMLTSVSNTLLVWNRFTFDYMKKKECKKEVKIIGNPAWAVWNQMLNEPVPASDKLRLVIATCLHSEYDSYLDSDKLYADYLELLSESIDRKKYEIVVMPHPVDNDFHLKMYKKYFDNVNSSGKSIYSEIMNSDILISRSSTVMEEANFLGITVVGFDIVPNGPLSNYLLIQQDPEVLKFNNKNDLKKFLDNFSPSEKTGRLARKFNTELLDELKVLL